MASGELSVPVGFLGRVKTEAEEANKNGQITAAQARFVELDKRKAVVKQFFEEYNEAVKAVVSEIGIDSYFQDADGTVYKTVKPSGTFVQYLDYSIDHTRRETEAKGSLSMKEAQQAGFELPATTVRSKAKGTAEVTAGPEVVKA